MRGRGDCSVSHPCEHGDKLCHPKPARGRAQRGFQICEHPAPEKALAAHVRSRVRSMVGRAGCLSNMRISPPSPHCSGDEEGEEGGSSTHHVLGPAALGGGGAQAGCVWLKGPAWCNCVSRDVPRAWGDLGGAVSSCPLPPPISRAACSRWPLPPLLFGAAGRSSLRAAWGDEEGTTAYPWKGCTALPRGSLFALTFASL